MGRKKALQQISLFPGPDWRRPIFADLASEQFVRSADGFAPTAFHFLPAGDLQYGLWSGRRKLRVSKWSLTPDAVAAHLTVRPLQPLLFFGGLRSLLGSVPQGSLFFLCLRSMRRRRPVLVHGLGFHPTKSAFVRCGLVS